MPEGEHADNAGAVRCLFDWSRRVPEKFPVNDVVPISETISTAGKTADPKSALEKELPAGPVFKSSSEQNMNEKSKDLKNHDSSPRMRTSDNFTDATIPRLR